MKPERTIAYQELMTPSVELGRNFLNRWFIPEVLSENTQDPSFLKLIGESLKSIGGHFPPSDPNWNLPRWEDRLSVLDLYDLDRKQPSGERDEEMVFQNLWKVIIETLNLNPLYIPVGTHIDIKKHDFLVTTPLSKAKEHVQEAEDSIKKFHETGEVGYYYRDCWPFPKNLKIGSKFFYVDNRAIRGFAVATNIDLALINLNMAVDTWRWINPIPCDYDKIKPPQRYAQATSHQYLQNIEMIQVIGGWLDPMPAVK